LLAPVTNAIFAIPTSQVECHSVADLARIVMWDRIADPPGGF